MLIKSFFVVACFT